MVIPGNKGRCDSGSANTEFGKLLCKVDPSSVEKVLRVLPKHALFRIGVGRSDDLGNIRGNFFTNLCLEFKVEIIGINDFTDRMLLNISLLDKYLSRFRRSVSGHSVDIELHYQCKATLVVSLIYLDSISEFVFCNSF
jgi:hypothetical protein